MAITSVGYSGSVGWAEWAQLMATLGVDYLVAHPGDLATTISGATAGEVTVSIGTACGRGVIDTVDAPEVVDGLTAPNTWYTIVLRRDWTGGAGSEDTTLVALEGGSTRSIAASRQTGTGVVDDQPIALVHRGATALDQVVDLRAWWGNGGIQAATQDALAYLARPGSMVQVAGELWRHPVGGSTWEKYTIPWGSVTSKPGSYPPSSHSHSAGQVTSGTFADDRMGASTAETANTVAKRDGSGRLHASAFIASNRVITPRIQSDRYEWNGGALTVFDGSNNGFQFVHGGNRQDLRIYGGGLWELTQYSNATDHWTGASANMYLSNAGSLFRSSSSRRYKTEIREARRLDCLLDVVPRTWLPKSEHDRSSNPDGEGRRFGAVAEELHELGLVELVVYDENGEPDAIAYDRVGVALIPLVRAHREEIAELRSTVASLEERLSALEQKAPATQTPKRRRTSKESS